MAADLTVDNLCAAIRHFLKEVADGTRLVHANTVLVLHGVAGDDVMKAVLEQLNGKLTIRVHEFPAELTVQPAANSEAVNLWHPSKERFNNERSSQLSGTGGGPRDEDTGTDP